jgi:hypothetical protein
MVQYIRDRDTVLDTGRISDYHTRERMPPGLSKGKSRALDDASKYVAEPASKRARTAEAQAQWSNSTVTSGGQFIPLTPDNEKASEPSTTKYDWNYTRTRQRTRGQARPK